MKLTDGEGRDYLWYYRGAYIDMWCHVMSIGIDRYRLMSINVDRYRYHVIDIYRHLFVLALLLHGFVILYPLFMGVCPQTPHN